jgi:hypothetical protein
MSDRMSVGGGHSKKVILDILVISIDQTQGTVVLDANQMSRLFLHLFTLCHGYAGMKNL